MKILFIGNVEMSEACLNRLLELKVNLVGVCCGEGENGNSDHIDLSQLCIKHLIPFMKVRDINSLETLTWIRERSPDVIFCVGWSRILKQELLEIPIYGVVGYHPAALPKNRGRHPIIWSIILGLKKTASTFFIMDSSVDTGNILSQVEVEVGENDDARILYDKFKLCAVMQIEDLALNLSSRRVMAFEQDHFRHSTWRKRGYVDGQIDWRLSAVSISRLVRALNKPYIGAHFITQGGEIKVWRVNIVDINKYGIDEMQSVEPGRIVDIKEGIHIVKCGDGLIELLEVEPILKYSVGSYL